MGNTLVSIMFFCLIAPLAITSIQAQNATLIDETCKLRPDLYNLCSSTLYSDSHIRGITDARDLAVIITIHMNSKAVETRDHISRLLQDPWTDRKVKELLNVCMDRYNTIIQKWVRKVREGLSFREYMSAEQAMGVVTTNVEMCERSFVAPVWSPISDDSKVMDDLTKIGYAIIFYKSHHPPLTKE